MEPKREPEESRSYRLEGRVQGVGFRWWTAREAEALGVRGWVRNLRGGAVEVHAAGTPDVLDDLEARLARGPRHANVRQLRRLGPGEDLPETGFEIRRDGGPGW
jgi:acylphosphatase